MLEVYRKLREKLLEHRREIKKHMKEEEDVLDEMDKIWYNLTNEERKLLDEENEEYF